jgi:23S rRNA pseudouridine2605 synthase
MERLNKFLAHAGVASRRQADQWIAAGRIRVNGEVVADLGRQIDPEKDRVLVDNQPVVTRAGYEYWMLNKPPGYLSTVRDPFQRPTVLDLLPASMARLYPVGRLDFDSSGLLLLTNDGDLTLVLTHPRHLIEKTYRVRVEGIPESGELQRLTDGVELRDGMTAPAKVHLAQTLPKEAVIEIIIREGRKRQVKRMFLEIGHRVLELERTAVGPLQLGNLKPGECRRLTEAELARLITLKERFQQEFK